MPIPKRRKNEDKADFLSRCMGDPIMNKDYPDNAQRYAVCQTSAKADIADNVKDTYYEQTFGSTEEITEDNFHIPEESDYVDFGEQTEEWNIAQDKPGLWENIRKKKEREGKKYRPAKPGDPDRPDPKSWKKAQSNGENSMQVAQLNKMHQQLMSLVKILESIDFEFKEWTKDKISKAEHYIEAIFDAVFYSEKDDEYSDDQEDMDEVEEPSDLETEEPEMEDTDAKFQYEDPVTKEIYLYNRMDVYRKNGRVLIYIGKAADTSAKKVKLNKPFRTPKGPKKFSVYVKNDKGNVVKVNFGDPNMDIKRDDPARRKSFRARHHCDTDPGPKWKARYWSCKFWSSENVSNLT